MFDKDHALLLARYSVIASPSDSTRQSLNTCIPYGHPCHHCLINYKCNTVVQNTTPRNRASASCRIGMEALCVAVGPTLSTCTHMGLNIRLQPCTTRPFAEIGKCPDIAILMYDLFSYPLDKSEEINARS